MKQNISYLLKEALKLPPEARAALAGILLDSLDETMDKDAETAWEAEILLRLKEKGYELSWFRPAQVGR